MIRKILGKIKSVDFGFYSDYPSVVGWMFEFSFEGGTVSSGMNYMDDLNILATHKDMYRLLHTGKVERLSQLKGKPVVITLEDNVFKTFRILEEVL